MRGLHKQRDRSVGASGTVFCVLLVAVLIIVVITSKLIVVGDFGLDVVLAWGCGMEGVRRVPINGPIPRIIMVALADEEKITRTLA